MSHIGGEIETNLRSFIDGYCNTDNISNLVSKKNGRPGDKMRELVEVSSHIMKFCDSLKTGSVSAVEKIHVSSPIYNTRKPLLSSFNDENIFQICNVFNGSIYWLTWETDSSTGDHEESIKMLQDIKDMYFEMTSNEDFQSLLMYVNEGFDINNLDSTRNLHRWCGVEGYFGPKSQDDRTHVSQIRTKRCKKPTEDAETDVIVLMYKILFDYCVQRFALTIGILEGKNHREKLKFNIERDISRQSSSYNIQKVLLQECMIRTKMVIYLRIFHIVCCTGKPIDESHWAFIQDLCNFKDVMNQVYMEIPDEY